MKSETIVKLKCAAPLAACLFLAVTGCNKTTESENPSTASTRVAPTPPIPKAVPPADASNGPDSMQADGVRRDVETALASNAGGVFPKGVKLNSAKIEAGVLSLDFNSAFNQTANMGESGESDIQKELMRIVAEHSSVEKMRVTVNGRPFESQATDWNTPFSIHSSAGGANPAHSAKAGR